MCAVTKIKINEGPWHILISGLNLEQGVAGKAIIANLDPETGEMRYRYGETFEPGEVGFLNFQFLGVKEVLKAGEEYVGKVCPILVKDEESGWLVQVTRHPRFGSGGLPVMEASRWSATNKELRPDTSNFNLIGEDGELGIEYTNTAVISGEGEHFGAVLLMVGIRQDQDPDQEYVQLDEFLDQSPDPHGCMAVSRALKRGYLN